MAINRNAMKSRISNSTDDEYDSPDEPTLAPVILAGANEYQNRMFDMLGKQINNYTNDQPTTGITVSAVAGSGKTTTIVAAANMVPTHFKSIFLAFNAGIAAELRERLPSHVEAKTLNALGYGVLMPYLKGLLGTSTDPQLNAYRTSVLMRSIVSYADREKIGNPAVSLVNMCKAVGVVPVGIKDAYGIDNAEATDKILIQICKHNDIYIDPMVRPTVFNTVRDILRISFSDANIYDTGTIDYDDQKWLSVCKRPNGRSMAKAKYDVIFVDEVQDVNATDIELIKLVMKPNAIIIGVGDKQQSIFGFRGSRPDAFGVFADTFDTETIPLSITYRCATDLVAHAQQLVPTITAAPNAPKGEVAIFDTWDASVFKPKDLVMCRNNAPLITFAYQLLKAKVPVYVKGRNIGDGLIKIITDCVGVQKWVANPKKLGKKKPIMSVDGVSITKLRYALLEWKTKQLSIIAQTDPDNVSAKARVEDRVQSINVFIDANSGNTVQSVIDDIGNMFSDDAISNAVVCSTIHKAKGLEADRAFIYNPDLLYPKYVKRGSWQYTQEQNLDYVARTRGKSLYGYLHVSDD